MMDSPKSLPEPLSEDALAAKLIGTLQDHKELWKEMMGDIQKRGFTFALTLRDSAAFCDHDPCSEVNSFFENHYTISLLNKEISYKGEDASKWGELLHTHLTKPTAAGLPPTENVLKNLRQCEERLRMELKEPKVIADERERALDAYAEKEQSEEKGSETPGAAVQGEKEASEAPENMWYNKTRKAFSQKSCRFVGEELIEATDKSVCIPVKYETWRIYESSGQFEKSSRNATQVQQGGKREGLDTTQVQEIAEILLSTAFIIKVGQGLCEKEQRIAPCGSLNSVGAIRHFLVENSKFEERQIGSTDKEMLQFLDEQSFLSLSWIKQSIKAVPWDQRQQDPWVQEDLKKAYDSGKMRDVKVTVSVDGFNVVACRVDTLTLNWTSKEVYICKSTLGKYMGRYTLLRKYSREFWKLAPKQIIGEDVDLYLTKLLNKHTFQKIY